MSDDETKRGPDSEANAKIVFLLSIFLCAVYVCAGIAKLAGASFIVDSFIRWGFPYWFVYPVGLAEIVLGGALMARGLSFHAAAGLGSLMMVAFGTHISADQYGMAVVPILLLVGLTFITYGRQLVRIGAKKKGKKTKARTRDKKRTATKNEPPSQSSASIRGVDAADLQSSLREFRTRTKSRSPEGPPDPPTAPAKISMPPPPKKNDDDDLPPQPL